MSATQDTPQEILDVEAVETHPVQHPLSTELVRRERHSEVMRPLDVEQLVDSFKQYQDMLPRLLVDSDYQSAGTDRDGNPRRFVKKSGWRKIATAFDLDVILVSDEVERDDNGRPLRAKVIARAIAPSGRTMDGDGYCSIEEDRFQSSRGPSTKVENDLRATATTRAKNRAIADLVGMGDVSAEEVTTGDQGPQYGDPVDKALNQNAGTALLKIIGGDRELGARLYGKIKLHCGGYFPKAAAYALLVVGEEFGDFDPVAPDIDAPSVDVTQTANAAANAVAANEASEALIAGLEDEALDLCRQLFSEKVATRKVREASGNAELLSALIGVAKQKLAEREAEGVKS